MTVAFSRADGIVHRGDFDSLPVDDLRRLLKKYVGRKTKDAIRIGDIAVQSGIERGALNAFVNGAAISRKRIRRLSRVLTQAEHGLLVKRGDDVLRLETPMKTPDHVFRVCISSNGKPTITRAEPPPVPKTMPRWFADSALSRR